MTIVIAVLLAGGFFFQAVAALGVIRLPDFYTRLHAVSKAETLGGTTIVPKTEVPGMGWFAIMTDPTGNRIGLWTNGASA